MTSKAKLETVSTPNHQEVQQLRDTIQLLDNFSQKGFSQIAAIARLTLQSLKVPEGTHALDDIAYALEAICEKAEYVEGCINAEAESFGCNYIDEDERRRWNARSGSR
ncbi:hypothetical protein C8R27_1096 [Nitrosomonas ureae]|uniref:hypothetical protein n=1 Tax=Nitrosomonas ureae TaxID=44577 RepID=UPI000D76AC12|nr:hypothetical protein [Nitrosomonas ureae]PXX15593.1 hypothetical protein C8R27_1096 [Nitrosomonas ureae]